MEKLATQLGVSYLDLLPAMELDPNWESYFLSCDRHWNKEGHTKAAAIIQTSDLYRAWMASGNITNNKIK
jgi:hypothetical protein